MGQIQAAEPCPPGHGVCSYVILAYGAAHGARNLVAGAAVAAMGLGPAPVNTGAGKFLTAWAR